MNRNLTKRILSLLLVLVLLISNVPAVVFAAEETTAATGEIVVAETSAPTEAEEPETEAAMAAKLELEATIEKQIRAFAKSIDKPGADDDAAREIAQHGMFGRGKKLSVGKSHALTATLMNWVSQGMKEDPEIMVKRTGRLLDGMIEKTINE